jgi:hypothetical protein
MLESRIEAARLDILAAGSKKHKLDLIALR